MMYKLTLQLLVDAELDADSPNRAKAKVIETVEGCGFLTAKGLTLFVEDVEITGIFDEHNDEIVEEN